MPFLILKQVFRNRECVIENYELHMDCRYSFFSQSGGAGTTTNVQTASTLIHGLISTLRSQHASF